MVCVCVRLWRRDRYDARETVLCGHVCLYRHLLSIRPYAGCMMRVCVRVSVVHTR
jgi:hypothetical protein